MTCKDCIFKTIKLTIVKGEGIKSFNGYSCAKHHKDITDDTPTCEYYDRTGFTIQLPGDKGND